jgi:hypothetical protein
MHSFAVNSVRENAMQNCASSCEGESWRQLGREDVRGGNLTSNLLGLNPGITVYKLLVALFFISFLYVKYCGTYFFELPDTLVEKFPCVSETQQIKLSRGGVQDLFSE